MHRKSFYFPPPFIVELRTVLSCGGICKWNNQGFHGNDRVWKVDCRFGSEWLLRKPSGSRIRASMYKSTLFLGLAWQNNIAWVMSVTCCLISLLVHMVSSKDLELKALNVLLVIVGFMLKFLNIALCNVMSRPGLFYFKSKCFTVLCIINLE